MCSQHSMQPHSHSFLSHDSSFSHNQGDAIPSASQANRQFYQQYKKIVETGCWIGDQLKQLVDSKEKLWNKLLAFEKKAEEEFKDRIRKEPAQRKKRARRTAQQIDKTFACPSNKCNRAYGSQGSLHQHLRLKHPQLLSKTI